MLISEQLQTIKTDLEQIQNIKNTLNRDITSKLDSYKEQTNKTITHTLSTQSEQTKQTLQSHIDTQLNTAKNTLKTELTQSIANTATTLQASLSTYAQGELLDKITEAKQEAIAKLDSTQIAEQIAQDENLKNHITQNIKTQTSEAIAEIDFKEPMRTIIEENLGKIPLNHAKIAEANLNALKPMILEQIENTIQTNTEAKFQEKIGDIDARAEVSHCYTISDKARAIGGGVLEAVTGFERMKDRFAIVILAAGAGTRFGGNKLNALVKNKPLYEHTLDRVQAFGAFPAFIVTGSEEIAREAEKRGITPVKNTEPEKGIALSLTMGLHRALEMRTDWRGILFSVCDQPGLDTSTMQQIFGMSFRHPGSIVCAGSGTRTGNPVCWDEAYFQELLELTGDEGGRQIMRRHKDKVRIVQADPEELKDIDRKEDL